MAHTLSDVARLLAHVGSPSPRMIQYYCDEGMVRPSIGASGNREFSRFEIGIAGLAASLNRSGLGTGAILEIVTGLRNRYGASNGNSLFDLVAHFLRVNGGDADESTSPPRLHIIRGLNGEFVGTFVTGSDLCLDDRPRIFSPEEPAIHTVVDLNAIVRPLLSLWDEAECAS